jgi:ribosome biogenesis GTPase
LHPPSTLEELGWDESFEQHWIEYGSRGIRARVVAEHRGAYVLATSDGDRTAGLAGRLRHAAGGRGDLPAVGDWVAALPLPGEERAIVQTVLPRRTKFSRKAAWTETREQIVAANVNVVFVVQALNGDLNLRRLERYLALVWESGATPVVVLNKSDLCPDVELAVWDVEAVAFGVPVIVSSGTTGEGIDALRPHFQPNRTGVLLGSSGVGKSTIVNRLLGEDRLRTNDIRSDGRGRHTTSHRQLIGVPGGGLIMDTPGMRELQLWDAADGMDSTFADIAELAARCRFNDCRHEREPGCAVLAADRDGTLPPGRLESYRKLVRELRSLEVRQDKRAAAEERRKWALRTREGRARARLRR